MARARPNPAHEQRQRPAGLLLLLLLSTLVLGGCSDQRSNEPLRPGTHTTEVAVPPTSATLEASSPIEDTTPSMTTSRVAVDGPPVARTEIDVPGTPIIVQVVDGASGAPIAGAAAVALDRGRYDLADYSAARRSGRPEADLRREFGQSGVTDDRGELSIDWSGKSTRVWVETTDGRVANASVKDSVGGRLVLRLSADRGIVVLVRDSANQPVAGVPIVATDLHGRGLEGFGPLVETNEAGHARLDPARLVLATVDGGAEPVFVGLGVVTTEALGVEVDLTQPPSGPIELVLPPFGEVSVRTSDTDETRSKRERPSLHMRARGNGEVELDFSAWIDQRKTVSGVFEGGAYRFRHVLLGQRLIVQADLLGGGIELPPLLEANGPNRAGERVELEVELSPMRTYVGRLALSSGEPLDTRGWIALIAVDGLVQASTVKVATNGAFELEVDARHLDRGLAEATFERHPPALFGEATDHTRPVPLPPRAGLGSIDLGTITVEQHPVIVAGRVVDERGAPVAAAEVVVEQRFVRSARATEGARFDPEASWKRVGSVRSSVDGSFAVRAASSDVRLRDSEKPAEELMLTVSATGRAEHKHDATLGRRDVVVTLVEAGSLRARLVHRTAPFPVHVGFELVDENGTVVRSEHDATHSVDFEALQPGRYVLKVSGPADSSPSHVIANLVVEGGAACADSRLDPVDLTEVLAVGQLEIVDDAGLELTGTSIRIIQRSDDSTVTGWPKLIRHAGADWLVFRRHDPPIVAVSKERYAESEQPAREGLNRHELVKQRRVTFLVHTEVPISDEARLVVESKAEGTLKRSGILRDGRSVIDGLPAGPARARLERAGPEQRAKSQWFELAIPAALDAEVRLAFDVQR